MRAVDGQDLAPGSPIRHHEKVDFYAQCDGKALENFKKRSTMMQLTCQPTPTLSPRQKQAGNQEALLVIQKGAEQEDGQQKGVEDLLLDEKQRCERKGGILCQ